VDKDDNGEEGNGKTGILDTVLSKFVIADDPDLHLS
jgi:hypothetical protein